VFNDVKEDRSSQNPKKSIFNMKDIVIISSILVVALVVAVVIISGFGGRGASDPNMDTSPGVANTPSPPSVEGELSGRYVDNSGYCIEFIGGDKENELMLFLKEDGLGEPMLTSYHGYYYLEGDNKISISYTVGMFGFGATPGTISEDKHEISIFGSTFIKQ
jgi:hypothetical protein